MVTDLTPEGTTTLSSDETKTKAIADEDQTRPGCGKDSTDWTDVMRRTQEHDRPHTLRVQHKSDGGKRHKTGMKGHQT
jgi:hypothetical protein